MISIIVPSFNEENTINKVIDSIKKLELNDEKEIIIVDDGSTDKTHDLIKNIKDIKIFRHRVNLGKSSALKTGFNNSEGDILVIIDADCTYPISSIPQIVNPIKEKKADLVIASRFLNHKTEMDELRYFGNKFFSLLITILTKKEITDGSSGMRAFERKVWENLYVKSKGLSWEVEMTTRAIKHGYRVLEIPIVYFSRIGKSKLNPFLDGIGFFFAIIKGRFM